MMTTQGTTPRLAEATGSRTASPLALADRDRDIVVDNVSKSFGETRALQGCSFRVRPGEIHAIVGENGSGKSTLAKILSGVLSADSGTVSVFGITPTSPVQARRLGVATIFQEVLVADEASVADNLFVGTDGFLGKSVSRAEKARVARGTLRRLALIDVDPDALVGSLPLSVKQWIVIGRGLLLNPKVLILDESSAALDLNATTRLHDEMRRLREGGSSVIIVTHRIAELVRITDRATILRDGQVVGELEKADINEHNLLTLMTPQSRLERVVQTPVARVAARASNAVLAAAGLKVQADADAFDFQLARTEIVGVAGLDGQGQENFVRLLAGIGVNLGGSVRVWTDDGQEHALRSLDDAEQFGVSYVSGDRKREGIFPNLSIYENLAIALFRASSGPLGWIRRAPILAAYETEVQRFSIKTGSRTNRITSLSGGNQQKVLIGRAFARTPRIIVLNDPARGVDLGTKLDLYQELRRYAASGGGVIYLSSEIEEFLGFADRVAVFHKGSIFRTFSGDQTTEDGMLAAMFGHVAPVTFDHESVGSVP